MATTSRTSGAGGRSAQTKEDGSSPGRDVAAEVRPSRPHEGRFEGHRSATLNLPFFTAQVRLPDIRIPSREDFSTAARGVQRKAPSGKALLFFGGLTATAALGAIEWPVAAAIGVGSALASRGGADPLPSERAAGQSGERGSTTESRKPDSGRNR